MELANANYLPTWINIDQTKICGTGQRQLLAYMNQY